MKTVKKSLTILTTTVIAWLSLIWIISYLWVVLPDWTSIPLTATALVFSLIAFGCLAWAWEEFPDPL